VTFLLASGGHNVGIVSDPAYAGSSYQVATRGRDEPYIDPETWARQAPRSQGSWWPEWTRWLERHSGARTAPPEMGCAAAGYPVLDDAPGQYVHMK
jgi:polyhydroxyalkanoate synthase